MDDYGDFNLGYRNFCINMEWGEVVWEESSW